MANLESYKTYGEMHGTMIFYDKKETERFLEHMEGWFGDGNKWLAYLEGFLEGLLGWHKARFRRAVWPGVQDKNKHTLDTKRADDMID